MILALSAGRDSPAELRVRLALDESGQRKLLRSPRPGVSELAVLCTCHRTEIYAVAEGPTSEALHAVAGLLPDLRPTDHHDLVFMDAEEAIEHLFRVACGLDSLVIGEPQVLGQVRRAYVTAKEEKAAGRILSRVFDRAIRLGKEVRAQSRLGRLGDSVGVISARFLDERFAGIEGRRGAIIGAGEAASDAASALAKRGADLQVLSRTHASAEQLAANIGAAARHIDQLGETLEACDFAVVAISGGLFLNPSQFPERSAGSPFVVLDLSVPSAVEIDGRPDLEMHTLEDLPGPRGPEITRAVAEAEEMVTSAVEELERWAGNRAAAPLIRSLRTRTEALVKEEVSRAARTLGLTDEQRERIGALGLRIANKILHEPTKALRESDEEARATIKRLLGLDTDQ